MSRLLKSVLCAASLWPLSHAVAADPAALVIGNADYEILRNASGAAGIADLEQRLTLRGFAIRAQVNAGQGRTRDALRAFEANAGRGDGALVHLAGRFVHSSTETYFLATDAGVRSLEALRREAIPLSTLTAILAASPGRAVLALGDAGDFAEDLVFVEPGVGPVAAPQGVTVLTGPPAATRAVLSDVLDGEALLDPMALRGTDVRLSGFRPRTGRLTFETRDVVAPRPDPRDIEAAFWDAVDAIGTLEAFKTYLDRYPDGIFATEADERLAALRDAPRRAAEAAEDQLGLSRDQRREVQRALSLLGYDPRGIDGIFGPGTRAAIGAFQRDEGFDVTGYLDREQVRVLDRRARARAETLEEEARREAERAAAADRDYWRRTGASGEESDLRRYLARYPNGIFAEEARADLRALEEVRRPRASAMEQITWQQVERNGSIGAYRQYLRRFPNGAYADAARAEIARLERQAERGGDRAAAARTEQSMNLSATTRRTVEQRLDALGYGPGPVDGNFDDSTRNALLRYQRDRDLPATGYMNDVTMVRILADTVISIFD